jgi:hypothetical protein
MDTEAVGKSNSAFFKTLNAITRVLQIDQPNRACCRALRARRIGQSKQNLIASEIQRASRSLISGNHRGNMNFRSTQRIVVTAVQRNLSEISAHILRGIVRSELPEAG